MKWFLLILMFPLFVHADIEVAFLEIKNYFGQVIELEDGGHFAHIAISYKNGWLHAHPIRGVEWVSTSDLEKMGKINAIVKLENTANLTFQDIEMFVGKSYDPDFSWSNDKIYCSELVGKILRIQPQPMNFISKIWSQKYKSHNGELGLSPDDIFRILKQQSL
jgi:hypothetical protein